MSANNESSVIPLDNNSSLRFIPFRKADVLEMCLSENLLDDIQAPQFRQLSFLLQSIFHIDFHQTLESLKNAYAPVNPDADTRPSPLIKNSQSSGSEFVQLLEKLLNKANYEQLNQSDLAQALSETSIFKIRLQVDFDDFSEVLLYCRGESFREENIKAWFGLKTKKIRFINYDRVMVYIKVDKNYQSKNSLSSFCRADATILKLFQNVPKADLEMLFPNTYVRMRNIDKLMIGVPAVISGGIVLTTKLGATMVLMGSLIGFWLGMHNQPVELNWATLATLAVGFAALGGYLWKQFNNFKNRKLRFMQTLTQSLYFKNLDNNAGVFHRLIDDAEEEECKEAILAYYFLLITEKPITKVDLDRTIESWFEEKWQCKLNFEIDDAMAKLIKLKLVTTHDKKLMAVPLDEGLKILSNLGASVFLKT